MIRRIWQRAGTLLNRDAATQDTEPDAPRLGEGPYGDLPFNRWANTAMAVLTPDDPRLPFSKEIH